MIVRRHQSDDGYDTDAMEKHRNVFYALVLAAAVVWLGPPMLGIGDGGIKDCGDLSGLEPLDLCAAPDGTIYRVNSDATDVAPVDAGEEKTLVGTIVGATADAQAALAAVMEVLKYGLLVAAVGSIGIMRVRPGPT